MPTMIYKSISSIFRHLSFMLMAPCFLFVSCIDEYNATLPSDESDLLVVEGCIKSGERSVFYLSRTMPINTQAKIWDYIISDATVNIACSDGSTFGTTYILSEGAYVANVTLDKDKEYSLVVEYNGDEYRSLPQLPYPTLPVEKLESQQLTPNSSIDILVTTAAPANPKEIQYFRWNYEETWELWPSYISFWEWHPVRGVVEAEKPIYPTRGWKTEISKDIMATSSQYYSNNQIVKYKLYDVPRDNERFSALYSTVLKQRSIRKEEYEYEEERKRIAYDMGGLFTPQPSALPTNIRCVTSKKSVVGYVGCSLNTAEYRIFIAHDKYNTDYRRQCDEFSNRSEDYLGDEHYFSHGYKIGDYNHYDGSIIWTNEKCVDVRVLGASDEKPDFWPEQGTY